MPPHTKRKPSVVMSEISAIATAISFRNRWHKQLKRCSCCKLISPVIYTRVYIYFRPIFLCISLFFSDFHPVACTCCKTKAICHFLFSFRFGFLAQTLAVVLDAMRCELAKSSWSKDEELQLCKGNLVTLFRHFDTFAFQMTVNYPLSTLPFVFSPTFFPPEVKENEIDFLPERTVLLSPPCLWYMVYGMWVYGILYDMVRVCI